MKSKKGMSMQELVPAILVIVLAAILLVFGLMMLDELLLDVSDDSLTIYNETLSSINTSTGALVAHYTDCGFNGMSVVRCGNTTNITDIWAAGNYTVSSRQGQIILNTNADSVFFGNNSWNCTYSFNFGNSSVCTDTNSTLEGIANFSDYIDLIVLAVVIAIVISLILLSFGTRRVR